MEESLDVQQPKLIERDLNASHQLRKGSIELELLHVGITLVGDAHDDNDG